MSYIGRANIKKAYSCEVILGHFFVSVILYPIIISTVITGTQVLAFCSMTFWNIVAVTLFSSCTYVPAKTQKCHSFSDGKARFQTRVSSMRSAWLTNEPGCPCQYCKLNRFFCQVRKGAKRNGMIKMIRYFFFYWMAIWLPALQDDTHTENLKNNCSIYSLSLPVPIIKLKIVQL